MDPYVVSLVVGAGGLLSMAVGGLGRHGGHAHGGARGGVHGAHAHGAAHVHGGARGHSAQTGHAQVANANAHEAGGVQTSHTAVAARGALWLLSTPRILFSALLGLGATGLALGGLLGGVALFGAAVAGGIVFERFVITPIWNLMMRFESTPSLTLESTLMDEATAVTRFDGNGEGIVSVELNGQVVQLLAVLRPDDRLLGAGVRAGQRVRVESVDSARNRCTVSVL